MPFLVFHDMANTAAERQRSRLERLVLNATELDEYKRKDRDRKKYRSQLTEHERDRLTIFM